MRIKALKGLNRGTLRDTARLVLVFGSGRWSGVYEWLWGPS